MTLKTFCQISITILFVVLFTEVIWGQAIDTIWATKDGYVNWTLEAVYNTIRDAADGENVTGVINVGQADGFYLFRSFLTFPNSGYNNIDSVVLELVGSDDLSTINFDIYIHSSYYTAIATTAYNDFVGWVSGGSHTSAILNDGWNSASFIDEQVNKIKFNSAGIDTFNVYDGDSLRIVLISKEDYNRSEPLDSEYLSFYGSEEAGTVKDPRLIIYSELKNIIPKVYESVVQTKVEKSVVTPKVRSPN